MTETGLSLGTPHYMSPEQATADKDISARSDIYSLASVLYEMLTGNPPHTGASAQQIIMKIIAEPVEAVTKYRKAVPPHVAAAVGKALEKLPADRFGSAKEFAMALTNPAFTLPTMSGQAAARSGHGGVPTPLFAATAAVAALALSFAVWAWRRPEAPVEVSRFSIVLPDSAALSETRTTARAALSRDGRMVAYVSGRARSVQRSQLYLRRLDRLTVERIPGTEGATNPAFSPDGRRIAFVSGSPRALKVVSLTGGPPQVLTDSLVDLGGVSWGADGYIYYDGHLEGDGLARIRENGGKPEIVSRPVDASESWHSAPHVHPNGRGVLFAIARERGLAPFDIAVLDLRMGTHEVLLRGTAPRYARSGHLVYATDDGTLMAVRFDADRLTIAGDPAAMAGGVAVWGLGRADLEISDGGTLFYGGGASTNRNRELVWVSRDGKVSAVDPGWTIPIRAIPMLSPDGRSVAVTVQQGSVGYELWIKQLDRGPASKLADGGAVGAWSPNGREIAFSASDGIHIGPADPSVLPRLRYPRPAQMPAFGLLEYSPDGQWIIATAGGDIYALGTAGDSVFTALTATRAVERRGTLSPDGRWMAYESDESGRLEIYVRPFPQVEMAKRQVSVSGGTMPRWSRDGRELFFLNELGEMIAIPVSLAPTFSAGVPRTLFREAVPFPPVAFDVHPDGTRFLTTRRMGEVDQPRDELVIVQNFIEELKARLPR